MKLDAFVDVLEGIAPTRLAEDWDNVGLLAGDPSRDVTRAIVTIDFTREVAAEAERVGADTVVAYHPPIFRALKRIEAGTPLAWALGRGVAIYSPHTALDAAEGGTNDVLADVIGLADRVPLQLHPSKDRELKLVTFVPHDAVEAVSRALFEAGAGRIGNYSRCSFRTIGMGTFFGEEGTSPTVGQAGKLETTEETRLETVVPVARVAAVLAALRASHPYEEPAFDLVRLAAPPDSRGMGRIGSLPRTERESLFSRIKAELGIDHLLVAGPRDGAVQRAAVCAGSAGDMLADAIRQGAELVLTGEIRHHDALAAAAAGVTVVCTLHSRSERVALGRYRDRIAAAARDVDVVVSRVDADPFTIA